MANELDGLPPHKMHCSNLAADALHAAINNYKNKKEGKVDEEPKKTNEACETDCHSCGEVEEGM